MGAALQPLVGNTMDHSSITLPVERRGSRVIVTVPEFVGPAVHDQVRDQILAHFGPGTATMIIDMSEATFIDASGLAVLMAAHHRAAAHGCSISVVAPHPMVTRMFFLSGADQEFTVHPSVHEALAADPTTAVPRQTAP